MYCNSCGEKLLENGRFCSRCEPQLKNNIKNNFNGDNHKNNVTGDNNIIFNQNQYSESVEIDYYREKKTKLPFSTSAVTTTASLFTFAGLLGILANISQVLSFFNIKFDLPFKFSQQSIIYLMITFILGVLLFVFVIILKRQGFVRVSLKKLGGRGINIESLDGRILLSKIKANCPYCRDGGVVTLVDTGNQTVGVCHRNPTQHRFEFDYTLLKGLDEET